MKWNRGTPRWKGFDYTSDQVYFVTSCVKNRVCCFGDVVDGKMILNEFGMIAHDQFKWLAQQYPYVVLHEFVVMPDHVHVLIEINRVIVGVRRDEPLRDDYVKIKSLGQLMGAYKTTVSKKIHLMGFSEFRWQRLFYDRVVRNYFEHYHISEYILNNPNNW